MKQPHTIDKDDDKPVAKPEATKRKVESKDDHVAHIAELAETLRRDISPSGAQTVADKIMIHVGAIQDPKSYEERLTAEDKAEADAEAIRKAERDKLKTPADPKAKVA